jgi:hypothetical protein
VLDHQEDKYHAAMLSRRVDEKGTANTSFRRATGVMVVLVVAEVHIPLQQQIVHVPNQQCIGNSRWEDHPFEVPTMSLIVVASMMMVHCLRGCYCYLS